jgi:outer membrane protein TolC
MDSRLLRALVLVLATVTARAETLDQAWQVALAQAPTLRAAQSRLAAAGAELEAARAGRHPAVSAASTITRWDTAPAFDFAAAAVPLVLPLFGGDSMLVSGASVTLPLYTSGMLRAGVDAAAAGRAVRERDLDVLSRDVKLAVAERFIAVLRAESALTAAEASTAGLESHARDVEDMFQNGQVPRNDSLASQVSLADAEQRELQARNALDVARAAYNRRLGRPLSAAVSLEDALPPVDPVLESATPELLVVMALDAREELAGLAAAARGLEARSLAARAETRPHLMLTGGYTLLENRVLNREDFWSLGLGVRWNFFDSGRSRNAADALSHQAAALGWQRDDFRTLIELEVREGWLRVRETRQRTGVAKNAIMQAEENLRVVRDRYRNGEGTNTEVLDAEALRATSRSNLDNAGYDAALAELQLARAVGLL